MLADKISFLEIQRWQAAESSSTVFAVRFFNKNKLWKTLKAHKLFPFGRLQVIYLQKQVLVKVKFHSA